MIVTRRDLACWARLWIEGVTSEAPGGVDHEGVVMNASIAVLGLLLALAGAVAAIYQAAGEAREQWRRSQERVLKFCAALADVADGLASNTNYPAVGSGPPIPSHLLLYLRDGLSADLRSCVLDERLIHFQADRYAVGLPHQISDICVRLYTGWESVSRVILSRAIVYGRDGPEEVDPHYLDQYRAAYRRSAWVLRERVTLLYQRAASQRLTSRSNALLYLLVEHDRLLLAKWARSRLKRHGSQSSDAEQEPFSVEALLG